MTERKASDTAQGVAVLRAVHQLIDEPPKILDDPVIVRILGEATRARIQDHPENYQIPHRRALRAQVLIRSRFSEDRLADAVMRGVRQFVILGAGMDTFAYRQPNWSRDLQIFEVDHPASQREKRRRLDASGISIQANLEFVEIDFERDSIHSALERSRFNFNQPAYFSCLGVLMYLTVTAIDAIFRFVASMPPSSEIVFSFANKRLESDLSDRPSIIERNAEAKGEPWLTKFDPAQLEDKLRSLGFAEILFLTPEMIAERYIPNPKNGLPIPKHSNIVSAKV